MTIARTHRPTGTPPTGSRRPRRAPRRQKHRWDDILVILEVARSGSFNRAARKLGVSQSTVSRRIAALEQAIGREIFDREPEFTGYPGDPARDLTELGEQLLSLAEQAEAAMLAFEAEVNRRVSADEYSDPFKVFKWE